MRFERLLLATLKHIATSWCKREKYSTEKEKKNDAHKTRKEKEKQMSVAS
jgi:hypothetical protein